MGTITDFSWLDGVDLEDIDDLYYLYNVIGSCNASQSCQRMGEFSCEMISPGRYLVKGDEDKLPDNLLLVSEKARKSFLDLLAKRCPFELGIEGHYEFVRAMEKDD